MARYTSLVSLAEHCDGASEESGFPLYFDDLRPDVQMLDAIEVGSESYVLQAPDPAYEELALVCDALLNSSSPDEYTFELQRLAHTDEVDRAMRRLCAPDDDTAPRASSDVAWPLVSRALEDVLNGRNAAHCFGEGLQLLAVRVRLVEHRNATSPPGPASPRSRYQRIQVHDSEMQACRAAGQAADVAFAAVITLLLTQRRVPAWLGTMLAASFREGHRATLRVSASILPADDELGQRALQLAGAERMDIDAKFKQATEVDRRLRGVWAQRGTKSVVSPFGDDDDDDDDADEATG